MKKRIYVVLISFVVLVSVRPAGATQRPDGHQPQGQPHVTLKSRKRILNARRRNRRRAVTYVCPMHPDIRERSRGTCPKCLMELVAEPRGSAWRTSAARNR